MTKLQFISSASYSSSSAACDIESGACQRAKLDPEKAAMGSISGTSSGSHASPCKKQQGREEALERRTRRWGGNSSWKSPVLISLRIKSYLLRNEWHWQRGCQSSCWFLFHSWFPSPPPGPQTQSHVPRLYLHIYPNPGLHSCSLIDCSVTPHVNTSLDYT